MVTDTRGGGIGAKTSSVVKKLAQNYIFIIVEKKEIKIYFW